jgi:holo-[acyl-carrier protein] synthase
MQAHEDGTGETKERLGSGPPIMRIAAQEGEETDGCAMLSISHDGDYATAVCIGYAEER